MERLFEAAAVAAWVTDRRAERARIGLVPTMGALHAGHASLIAALRPLCDALVVSVYVNPLQFGPSEDLARYPRSLDADAALAEAHGADLCFAPDTLYPTGFATSVDPGPVAGRWEGAVRPGHFAGVATVCVRLFGLTGASVAAFGEKDWQQLAVIRRVVDDLALPTRIVACGLVRDVDGVALSSRNAYLSPADRVRARSLSAALFAMRDLAEPGRPVQEVLAQGRAALDVDALDYLAVVDEGTLEPLDRVGAGARALVAARVGTTRLIDNVALGGRP
jgi:pantoate--beta-alanine ligase